MLMNITFKIRQDCDIKKMMEFCEEFHFEMFKQISPKDYQTRYIFIKNSNDLMTNESIKPEFLTLSVFFFIPESKRPTKATIPDIIQNLVNTNDIEEIQNIAHHFHQLDLSIFVKCIVKKGMEIISSYGSSISVPILVPIIKNILNLINEYKEFSNEYQTFGEYFIPIAALLSAYINVDCIEHESFCSQALLSFRVFLHKIFNLSQEKGKESIDSILKQLKLVNELNSISFYARFHFEYGSDLVTTDNRAEEIHKLLVKNDFLELSNIFMPTSILPVRIHFFTLLKVHEFSAAREEFKEFSSQIQKLDFQMQREFVKRLVWALKSPLCIDEQWIHDPVINIFPQPIHISCKRFIQSKIPAFYPSCNNECSFYLSYISESESDVLRFLVTNSSFKVAFSILSKHNFEPSLFIHSVLVPSLSIGVIDEMITVLLEYDEYLEYSYKAINEAITWSKRMNIPYLRYKLDLLASEYQDAIDATEDIYMKERNPRKRLQIIKKALDDIPEQVDKLAEIRFEEEFIRIIHENKIKITNDLCLFKECIPTTLSFLFENKLQNFAIKFISELNINPAKTIEIIIPKLTLSKARTFVQNFEKYANETVSQTWITVLLSQMNNNPKTKPFVVTIIEKDVKDSRVKCHLFLQFNMIENAKRLAEKEKLTDFLNLLSF